MKFMLIALLLVGCSVPDQYADTQCTEYYGGRIGMNYAKEVCN